MPRKETITREKLLDTAFAMASEEGVSELTARKIAARAECSTQPIFRIYKNMEELWGAVYDKSMSYFQDYYSLYPRISHVPFVNLGLAYVSFARKEGNLFRLLFLEKGASDKSMYEILNGKAGNVVAEINSAKSSGCEQAGELFVKMWIFIHGVACMTLTGDYDLSDAETREQMEQTYRCFLNKVN